MAVEQTLIDIKKETVVTFSQAANYCPGRRNGRKPHVSTFYRWSQQGLETIRVGGQLCTSVEALQRFFDRLSLHSHSVRQPAKSGSSAKIRVRPEQIEQELTQMGI